LTPGRFATVPLPLARLFRRLTTCGFPQNGQNFAPGGRTLLHRLFLHNAIKNRPQFLILAAIRGTLILRLV
jgi:hypothetical protein